MQKFLAMLRYDLFIAILPLVGAAAAQLAKNPSPMAAVAIWSNLQVQVLAAVPALESTVLSQLANAINSEIQNLIAQAAKASAS